MDSLPSHTFRAVSYPWRLYAGADALRHLPEEVRRHKAQRAFVVCGQTVAHKTNLLARVKDQLGTLYAGVFDAMDTASTSPSVEQGTEAARVAGRALPIAIGGGSVIVGTRLRATHWKKVIRMRHSTRSQRLSLPRLWRLPPIITSLPTGVNRAGSAQRRARSTQESATGRALALF